MLITLLLGIPTLLLVLALGGALILHPFAGRVGWRYLRSKKRRTVSVITFIAVGGVALGVAALLSVMSITSGFQREFRDKVLGVNAHVLVLKYGLDFREYRDVVERVNEIPEVAGAAPFLINQMMIANGERTAGVLLKGVEPSGVQEVLDLPRQIVDGLLDDLRLEGSVPPVRPEDLIERASSGEMTELDRFLRDLANGDSRSTEASNESTEAPQPSSESMVHEGALPEVDVPTPEVVEAALASEDIALPPDEWEDQMFLEDEIDASDEETQLPGIVIGTTLARNLGVGVGDSVHLISPLAGLDTSMFGGVDERAPRSHTFEVIALFEAGFEEYDSRLVYVDLYQAQEFFDHGDSVTGVEIRLHDLNEAPSITRRIQRMLGGGPYHMMDWQELNRNLFTALELQKLMLSLVIAIIIFVAAFNVVVTLIMIVLEKKREIAILKAMGATDFSILLIFMVQGLLIGLVGTLIGIAIGGGVCLYLDQLQFPLDPSVYLIDHLPVRTSVEEFLRTGFIAIFICVLATLAPSWWAARLLPADGVRYE